MVLIVLFNLAELFFHNVLLVLIALSIFETSDVRVVMGNPSLFFLFLA